MVPRKAHPRLPAELVAMVADGSWSHPGEETLLRVIPYIREPLVFRTSLQVLEAAEEFLMHRDRDEDQMFHEYRGSTAQARGLPWRDVENSILIAVNEHPGDDVAIGLDFRTSEQDPRVIASEWIEGPGGGCFWREVAPTFTQFVRLLYPDA